MPEMVETVGAMLINSNGAVLLGLRSPSKKAWPSHWDIIGGHVEDGETLEEALIREVKEEVGVTPLAFKMVAMFRERQPELYGDALHRVYAVRNWNGGEPENISDEHTELKWFSIKEMLQLENIADAEYATFARLALSDPEI